MLRNRGAIGPLDLENAFTGQMWKPFSLRRGELPNSRQRRRSLRILLSEESI